MSARVTPGTCALPACMRRKEPQPQPHRGCTCAPLGRSNAALHSLAHADAAWQPLITMLTLTRAIDVPLPCRSSRFSIRRALATPSISTRSSRCAAHDGPQRACVPCARSSRDPRCCTCSRCRVSGCTHRIRAPPGHGYDVVCVACAFACVFIIPMRKIYQKLGRVRSNYKTMILRPWSVWSTYHLRKRIDSNY